VQLPKDPSFSSLTQQNKLLLPKCLFLTCA
jgi:hypothetical protein